MATIREFIEVSLGDFGYELSSVKMDVLLMRVGVDDNTEVDNQTLKQAFQAIAYIIPELLTRDDVTEGGYSVKRNTVGIIAYYNSVCAEWGFENKLAAAQPTISDASNRW